MKKKNNYLIFTILAILLVVGIYFGSQQFSVIGQFTDSDVKICIFSEGGGVCDINLTLPEYRKLEKYTLDLKFEASNSNYTSEVLATQFFNYNGYTTDSDGDYTDNKMYYYKIPSTWNLNEIYLIKINSTLPVTNAYTNEDLDIYLQTGYITKAIIGNPIVCTIRTCATTEHLIQHYLRTYSTGPSEWKFLLYNTALLSLTPKDFGSNEPSWNGEINSVGNLLYKSLPSTLNETNIKDNLLLVSYVTTDKEGGSTSGYTLGTPKTYLSYARELFPKSVSVMVGDKNLQTGINNNITTNDMFSLINEYCSRNLNVTQECNIPIKIESAEGGKIIISGETSKLLAMKDYVAPIIEEPVIPSIEDPEEPSDEGFDFGYIWLIGGVLLIIIILYLVNRGK